MSVRSRVFLFSLMGILLVGFFADVTFPVRTLSRTVFGTPVGLVEGVFGEVWNSVHVSGFFVRGDGRGYAERTAEDEMRTLTEKEKTIASQGEQQERGAGVGGQVASVLRRSFGALEQSLVLLAPSSTESGDLVYAQGALIGTVTHVANVRAVVELLWSPGKETPALLASPNVPVVLVGQGAGFWSAKVPRSQKVEVGDVVVTNHASQEIIGSVRAVKPESASPFTEFIVRSPINPTTVQWVTLKAYAQ